MRRLLKSGSDILPLYKRKQSILARHNQRCENSARTLRPYVTRPNGHLWYSLACDPSSWAAASKAVTEILSFRRTKFDLSSTGVYWTKKTEAFFLSQSQFSLLYSKTLVSGYFATFFRSSNGQICRSNWMVSAPFCHVKSQNCLYIQSGKK